MSWYCRLFGHRWVEEALEKYGYYDLAEMRRKRGINNKCLNCDAEIATSQKCVLSE